MNLFLEICEILLELLDIQGQEIKPETYLIRDLGAESIDLLELSVAINNTFKINVIDDDIFLIKLRDIIFESKGKVITKVDYLSLKFPFLTKTRINEILDDLENGPVLQVKDLLAYIEWKKQNAS